MCIIEYMCTHASKQTHIKSINIQHGSVKTISVTVTFLIHNNTYNHIRANYVIRAHRRSSNGSMGGASAISNNIVSELSEKGNS